MKRAAGRGARPGSSRAAVPSRISSHSRAAAPSRINSLSRAALAAVARAGFPSRGGGSRAVSARAAVGRLLWSASGERRVPAAAALDQAVSALPAGELAWLSEFNPLGPLYLFPTSPFLRALAARVQACGARRVVEVAAGDGFLSRALSHAVPDLKLIATDSGAWGDPAARMSAAERRGLRGQHIAGLVPGPGVRRLEARAAIASLKPDLVLACWLPPGPVLARLIRSPVRYVLELGAGSGVTGDARCWRFEHEFCEELERTARCRLDERPRRRRHTTATLYLGAAHPDFAERRHWMF